MPARKAGRLDARTQARQDRIVEDVVQLIDYTSRVLQGVERGDWYYVADKVDGLRKAVNGLERHVDLADRAGELNQITGEVVWLKIALDARHYWVGRAIFDERQDVR